MKTEKTRAFVSDKFTPVPVGEVQAFLASQFRGKTVTMQRRHFEMIAATLKSQRPAFERGEAAGAWNMMVAAFANSCGATNPNFNRPRFIEACGGLI